MSGTITATWIDQQPPGKIAAAVEELAAAGWTWQGTNYLTEAGGDQDFALWLYLVDRRICRRCGLTSSDLEDWRWRDEFDAGASPRDAVAEFLEEALGV